MDGTWPRPKRCFSLIRCASAACTRGLRATSAAQRGAWRSRSWIVGRSGGSRPSANASMNASSRSCAASRVAKRCIAWRDCAVSRAVRLSMRNSSVFARLAGSPPSSFSRSKSSSKASEGTGAGVSR